MDCPAAVPIYFCLPGSSFELPYFGRNFMSTTPVAIDQAASPAELQSRSAIGARLLPAMLAAALGLVLLYGAGFSSMEALHNATHDSRHSAGFPCH